jgi:hypothetical protein
MEMEERMVGSGYGSMNDLLSPDYWHKEIQSLYELGRVDEARKQLSLFKEAFPEADASELESLVGK